MSEEISQRQGYEGEEGMTEVEKIASQMTGKQYFLQGEHSLLQNWQDDSIDLYKNTENVFTSEYEIRASRLIESEQSRNDEISTKCRKEFEAYCILNRKVQKKSDEIENFAGLFNSKNQKRTFFNLWKGHNEKKKYLRRMQDKCDKYYQARTAKMCLKHWLGISMDNTRSKIKNEVYIKTEVEICKIQTEYERLIKNLEDNLEKRLLELKKEEEEHKLLHDKYENMYQRAQVQ